MTAQNPQQAPATPAAGWALGLLSVASRNARTE